MQVLLQHLKGMLGWEITYGTKVMDLQGYTDADGSMNEDRHAVSGYVFLIDGGPIWVLCALLLIG